MIFDSLESILNIFWNEVDVRLYNNSIDILTLLNIRNLLIK